VAEHLEQAADGSGAAAELAKARRLNRERE
jgi:hypothetical protein